MSARAWQERAGWTEAVRCGLFEDPEDALEVIGDVIEPAASNPPMWEHVTLPAHLLGAEVIEHPALTGNG